MSGQHSLTYPLLAGFEAIVDGGEGGVVGVQDVVLRRDVCEEGGHDSRHMIQINCAVCLK